MLRNVVALLIVTAFADSVVEPRQDWVMIPCSRKFQRSSIGLVKETEENDYLGCLLTERFQCFLPSSSINPELVYTNLHSGGFWQRPWPAPWCAANSAANSRPMLQLPPHLSQRIMSKAKLQDRVHSWCYQSVKVHDQGSASCKQVMHEAESPCVSSSLSQKKTAHCSTIYSGREEGQEFND